MKKFIEEETKTINGSDTKSFYNDVCRIVNYLEPSIGEEESLEIIKSRDKLGDGLVSDDSLIIHIISKKVKKNQAVYCYLTSPVEWRSSITNMSAKINKAVILLVAPDLKDGELLNLENFIENKRMDQVENLVMR